MELIDFEYEDSKYALKSKSVLTKKDYAFFASKNEITWEDYQARKEQPTLTKEDCTYFALARDIVCLKYRARGEDIYHEDVVPSIDGEASELATFFYRSDGYIYQLKRYLNLDLDSFDKNNLRYQCEKFQILYMFYMLKNKIFPKTEVIQLFGKPSMESIDGLTIGWKTYNYAVVALIKYTIVRAIPEIVKGNIINALNVVSYTWNDLLDSYRERIEMQMDFDEKLGLNFEYDLSEAISLLNCPFEASKNSKISNNDFSPLETLYLRVLQYEHRCQIIDILFINSIQNNNNYNVPLTMIPSMKEFSKMKIKENPEKYINANANAIAKYVYAKEKVSENEINRIKYHSHKVPVILRFFSRSRYDIEYPTEKLLIISCLQAILLDSKNEIFDYTFQGYEKYKKQKPGVQAALKGKEMEEIENALQVYWTRKVMDHWYANIGRHNLRCELRKLENAVDQILMKAFSCSTISEMLDIHTFYCDKITS